MKTYRVEILTPCFCAGANQAVAEIRAPSIRGELRWWFRTLGGSAEQEKEVFGGVHNAAKASAVTVRIAGFRRGPEWKPPHVNPNDVASYVWYYASASNKKARWTPQGALPPGSGFDLALGMRRPLPDALAARLDAALEAFLRFGSLGLRATRGLGSLHAAEFAGDAAAVRRAADRLLRPAGFRYELDDTALPNGEAAIRSIGDRLKNRFRAEMSSEMRTALGWSLGKNRQASALRFRVLRTGEKEFRVFTFEAPHERVLAVAALDDKRWALEA